MAAGADLVEGDQAAVRDRNPVGVAGQVGKHRLRPGEGRLGVDDPLLPSDGSKVAQEGASFGEVRHGPEEGEPPGVVQRDQPRQKDPSEQLAEHAHRKREGWTRGDPSASVGRDAAAWHDHVHVRMVGNRRSPGVEHGGDADARAPRCFGSEAIVSIVSDAALNSRS